MNAPGTPAPAIPAVPGTPAIPAPPPATPPPTPPALTAATPPPPPGPQPTLSHIMIVLGVIALLALITMARIWGIPGRLDRLEDRVGLLQIGMDSLRSDAKTINGNIVAAHQDLATRSDGLQKIVVDGFSRTDAALKNVATKSDIRRIASRRHNGDSATARAALCRIERKLDTYGGLKGLSFKNLTFSGTFEGQVNNDGEEDNTSSDP